MFHSFLRRRRKTRPTPAAANNDTEGSGTTDPTMLRAKLLRIIVSPVDRSARYKLHNPLGSSPLNDDRYAVRGEVH
jgi:hypothetical protein